MSHVETVAPGNISEHSARAVPEPDLHATDRQVGDRVHRVLVPSLFAVATIVTVLAMFAVWANRQLLNTDNWTNTSAQLLADKQVQSGLSDYLVNQIFSHVNVQREVQGVLPSQASLLAQPVAAGLRELANRAIPEILASAPVQTAWQQANRITHRTLVKVIEGGNKYVSTTNGAVTLNLGTVANDVAQGVGITANISGGQVTVFNSDKLKTAQDVVGAIQRLAIWAPLVALALFVGGVALARDWRRRALRDWGFCLVGAGLVTILLRRILGHWVVNHEVSTLSLRPAADSVWFIGTSLLDDIAIAVLVYGLLLVVASWLAGPRRVPVAIRSALAAPLRLHPVMAYGATALLFVLVVLWGPTPAWRQVIPVLLFALLAGAGMFYWTRQISSEFPGARPGETIAILQRTWADWRQSWQHTAHLPHHRHGAAHAAADESEPPSHEPPAQPSSSIPAGATAAAPVPVSPAVHTNDRPLNSPTQTVARRSPTVPPAPAPVAPAPPPGPQVATIEQLERLSALYSRGQLSDGEFAAAKAQMIGSLQ